MFTTTFLAQSPAKRRIRRLTLFVWCVLLIATISLYIVRQITDGPYGKDFTIFITGANILAHGHAANLYDLPTQTAVQQGIGGGVRYLGGVLPFNYPPYIAALFIPLTSFPPDTAYYIWVVVQWGVLALLMLSVRHHFRKWHSGAPPSVVLALGSFVFVYEAFLMGQMSVILLLLWWLVFVNWREQRWELVGICLALAGFKPQMAIVLAAALVFQKHWKAVAYAFGAQAVLWAGAVVVAGPGIVGSYLGMMRLSSTTVGTLGFYPAVMPNLRGLITDLGVPTQLTLQIAVATWLASIILCGLIWRLPWSIPSRFGIMAIIATIFNPHLYMHDASLLMLAVFCAELAYLEQGTRFSPRWLLLPFLGLFMGTYSLVLAQSYALFSLMGSVWFFCLIMLAALVDAGHRSSRKGVSDTPASGWQYEPEAGSAEDYLNGVPSAIGQTGSLTRRLVDRDIFTTGPLNH